MAKWNAIPFYVGQKQLRQQLKDDTAAKWNAVPFCVFLEMQLRRMACSTTTTSTSTATTKLAKMALVSVFLDGLSGKAPHDIHFWEKKRSGRFAAKLQ